MSARPLLTFTNLKVVQFIMMVVLRNNLFKKQAFVLARTVEG